MMLPEKIFKTVKDYYNKCIESNPKVESTAGVSQFSPITLPEDVETPILDFITKVHITTHKKCPLNIFKNEQNYHIPLLCL